MANKKTQKVYEISFHLIPTIDKEKVPAAYERIKGIIAKEGEIVSDEEPMHMDLAYTIRHPVRQSDGSYNNYNEAYFGSVKFKASQEFVKKLHKEIQNNEEALRFLILETAEEDTRIGKVLPGTEEEEEGNAEKEKEKDKNTTEKENTDTDKVKEKSANTVTSDKK